MHTILFDIDGTLIRSGGAGRDALEAALLEEFGKVGSEAIDIHGRTDRGIIRSLLTYHGVEYSPVAWERFRTAYLRALPEQLRIRGGYVLPGVPELLQRLVSRDDVAVGLLTGNMREGARIKLSHFELFHHFRFGGFGDVHYERDEVARDAYAAATQHWGQAPEPNTVWVIGDTPSDVQCARAIGAKAIAVATGFSGLECLADCRPDLLMKDLSDVEEWLEMLC
jgi:phosphoglycolate phosphatase-like HAD superfamily hydrolase